MIIHEIDGIFVRFDSSFKIKTNTDVWEVHTRVRTVSYGPPTDQSQYYLLYGRIFIFIHMVE